MQQCDSQESTKQKKITAHFIWRWLTQTPWYCKNMQSSSSITNSHQMLLTCRQQVGMPTCKSETVMLGHRC